MPVFRNQSFIIIIGLCFIDKKAHNYVFLCCVFWYVQLYSFTAAVHMTRKCGHNTLDADIPY